MADAPLLTVVLTTYNGSQYIGETIASILSQTFNDFELFIIDDASTDNTLEVVDGFDDSRIQVIRNEQNTGVCPPRNLGINLARGKYYAAHDHDDLSHPQRFETQIEFLENNPDIVLVGTGTNRLFNGEITPTGDDRTADPLILLWTLHIKNALTHSSIMMRTDVLKTNAIGYRSEFQFADDFDLYHQLLRVGEIRYLADRLMTYRVHQENAFKRSLEEMRINSANVLSGAFENLFGETIGMEDIRCLQAAVNFSDQGGRVGALRDIDVVGTLLTRITVAVARRASGDRHLFGMFVADTWWKTLRNSARFLGPSALRYYDKYPQLSKKRVGSVERFGEMGKGAVYSIARKLRPSH